ncbi:hypothetical protein ACJX0J_040135, partial [Zea mays]
MKNFVGIYNGMKYGDYAKIAHPLRPQMGAWPYIHILKRMRPDMLVLLTMNWLKISYRKTTPSLAGLKGPTIFPPVEYALRSNSLNVYLNMDLLSTFEMNGGQEGQPAQGDSTQGIFSNGTPKELLDSPLWDLVIPGVAPDVESTILSIHLLGVENCVPNYIQGYLIIVMDIVYSSEFSVAPMHWANCLHKFIGWSVF